MLPNTSSLLKQIHNEVITTFKIYYLRNTFIEMMTGLGTLNKTSKDYWWFFDILIALKN